MSVSKRITTHLGKHRVDFEVVPHRKVYTAYDLAQTLGEKLESIAKTLLVKVDIPELKQRGAHYVVVVPASYHIDLEKVKKALRAKKISLSKEKAILKLGIKPGALSPFGSLRGLGVVVDKGLLKTKSILVGAESFTDSVRLRVKDLVAIEAPVVAVVGKKNALKLQSKKSTKKKTKKKKNSKKKTSIKNNAVKRKSAKRKPAKCKPVTKKKTPAKKKAIVKKKKVTSKRTSLKKKTTPKKSASKKGVSRRK